MKLAKHYGDYIVADPKICHGHLTFRGTRIFVHDVLDQLAKGQSWRTIEREWEGRVTRPMIAEAICLARRCLLRQRDPRWLKSESE